MSWKGLRILYLLPYHHTLCKDILLNPQMFAELKALSEEEVKTEFLLFAYFFMYVYIYF